MSTNAIEFTAIRDNGDLLNKAITSVIQTHKTYRQKLKVVMLASVWHACKYGQTAPMYRLFDNLVSNDQVAFRQFLRRLHIYVARVMEKAANPFDLVDKDGKAFAKEIIDAYANTGVIFSYKAKQFQVVSSKTDSMAKEKRQIAMELVSNQFLNSDDKAFAPFYERNNFADMRVVGDAQVLDRIKVIMKDAGLADKKPNPDRVKVLVSDQMKAALTSFFGTAEEIAENTAPPVDESAEVVDDLPPKETKKLKALSDLRPN